MKPDTKRIEKLQKIVGKQAIQIEILKKTEEILERQQKRGELKKEGYTIKAACEALGIARSSYYRNKKKGKAEQREVRKKQEEKLKPKIQIQQRR